MTTTKRSVDKPFLLSIISLMVAGVLIFSSASLGLLTRADDLFKSVLFNQLGVGLGLGAVAMAITSFINYRHLKRYALPLYICSLIGLVLVFIPHIGVAHGGARRWIDVLGFSIQPSEIYKICFVIFFALWLSKVKNKVATFRYGTLPFIILLGISAALIVSQPDTATFGIVACAGVAMYLSAGARWRDLGLFVVIGLLGIGVLALTRPYIMSRIETFIHPAHDATGSGYQIQQSMIAIGSGQLLGKGFGQSVQKFNFLPEPIGDSIYAVAGEEFGFLGAVIIILLYVIFALRGFKIAAHTPDLFGRLLVVGIVILIVSGSFVNISSMLGLIPVSGVPLIFISHGGTALFIALIEVGIILNISKYQTA